MHSTEPAQQPAAYTVDGALPSRLIRPASEQQVATALAEAKAAGAAVIPWGGGTRIHVGNPPERYDIALDLTELDHTIDHEPGDLTVVVSAGVRVADLQQRLAQAGQRLPFDPPHPERATIGGSIASNAAGSLRSAFGSIRELIIGMKVAMPGEGPAGTLAKSGGRVVKNVQGFDLHRLHVGSLGTLGVIVEVALKLTPAPPAVQTVAAWFQDLSAARDTAFQVFNGPFQPEALVVLSGARAPALLRTLGQPETNEYVKYLLLARLAGERTSILRQVDLVTGAAGAAAADGVDVIAGDDAGLLWEAVAAVSEPAGALVLRTTLKPTKSFELLASLESVTARTRGFEFEAALHASFGTLLASWRPAGEGSAEDSAALRHIAVAALDAVRERGATALFEAAPPGIKQTLDVFGDMGNALEIMKRLKAEFDPHRVLSPGRFAGGI